MALPSSKPQSNKFNYLITILRCHEYIQCKDVKFVFFQIRISTSKIWIKLKLFYIFVEKLKQFAFDVCTVGWDEGHSTHAISHTGKQSINSAISQNVKPCLTLLPLIDVCPMSGPPRFVALIACISIQHAPGAQCKMERW